jgi:hypothetical protein
MRLRESSRTVVAAGSTTPEVSPMHPESTRFRRVNLLRAHGSPTNYLYSNHGCRCQSCRGAASDYGHSRREIHAEYMIAWRKKNPLSVKATSARQRDTQEKRKKVAARHRAWRAANPGSRKEENRRFREEHPDRVRVYWKVDNAIRSGRLVPEPCHICGDKAVAHHQDYSKPLEVEWLCPYHHSKAHRSGES